jgi:putative transposase
MPSSYTNLLYHLVFSTKNREPLITDDKQSGLYNFMGGILRSHGGIALEINGMPDHSQSSIEQLRFQTDSS